MARPSPSSCLVATEVPVSVTVAGVSAKIVLVVVTGPFTAPR
jgi:hypothetical protein